MSSIDKRIYQMQAEICKSLANPLRIEIINTLKEGAKTVTELMEIIGVNQANLSQHLAILRSKKIVEARRKGNSVYYSLANPKIIEACNLLRQILREQLEAEQKLVATK
ncbi:MAG: metalloregulator ArsR/SmtB family transcription factor [Nitrososphaerales archaeon]